MCMIFWGLRLHEKQYTETYSRSGVTPVANKNKVHISLKLLLLSKPEAIVKVQHSIYYLVITFFSNFLENEVIIIK